MPDASHNMVALSVRVKNFDKSIQNPRWCDAFWRDVRRRLDHMNTPLPKVLKIEIVDDDADDSKLTRFTEEP